MPKQTMPAAFHIMAKPACNLNCDYCFFLKKEELYRGSSFWMSDDVHEARRRMECAVAGTGEARQART